MASIPSTSRSIPRRRTRARPRHGQLGLAHIAFKVASYAALREAYAHLLKNGVEIQRAADHVCQRSIYFADPDGNGLEIYYEMPRALELFPNGRGDEDEVLPLSSADDPLPQWLVEEWPGPAAMAKVERLRRQPAPPAGRLTFPAKRLEGGKHRSCRGRAEDRFRRKWPKPEWPLWVIGWLRPFAATGHGSRPTARLVRV